MTSWGQYRAVQMQDATMAFQSVVCYLYRIMLHSKFSAWLLFCIFNVTFLYKNGWSNNKSKKFIHIQYAYCRNSMSTLVVLCHTRPVFVCAFREGFIHSVCSWVVGQHTLVVSTDQEGRRKILCERFQPGHVQMIGDGAFTGDGHAPVTQTHTLC